MNCNRTDRVRLCAGLAWLLAAHLSIAPPSVAGQDVEQYGLFEMSYQATGRYANPYAELDAEVVLTAPDGSQRRIPLFWDGGSTWRLRLSPNSAGEWSWEVASEDQGLNGKRGTFQCIRSQRRGSIKPMNGTPYHFQYQNGDPMWFMGDTAWALFTDSVEEKHDRTAAEQYLKRRAHQGFNVVHSMMLSEAGWGNVGGPPFQSIDSQTLNPQYWQEVDHRIKAANQQGIVVGLAVAWGDKRKVEPYAWRRFPDLEARKRYARYIAARYSAFDTYFIVSGEWHAEIRVRDSTEQRVKREFVQIGDALYKADPHDRMIAIHPMTQHGSVREFNDAKWMSFGDYQQNYRDVHARMLESRVFDKPVVNSEYGYHLRDRDGDGTPDKDNSTSLESIRHASWDIVMAGGYLVTGFGTTYFGGNRDPGPFDVDAAKNREWEKQMGVIRQIFTEYEWWKLEPHDDWLKCKTARGKDGRQLRRIAPPATTCWMLAEPGKCFLVYARGLEDKLSIRLGEGTGDAYRICQVNLRTGEETELAAKGMLAEDGLVWTPTDRQDWVLVVRDR